MSRPEDRFNIKTIGELPVNTVNTRNIKSTKNIKNTRCAIRPAIQSNPGLHALMWLALAVAGLLLAGFVAVVNSSIERGELRRENQSLSGSRLLPDEAGGEGVALGAAVLVPVELVASADQPR